MTRYKLWIRVAIILGAFLVMSNFAYATSSTVGLTCNPQSGGSLDNMILNFVKSSVDWAQETNIIAHKIFILLFAMEFMWQLVVKKIFIGDIEKLWVFFLVRIIMGLFFAKFVINIRLYEGIIQYMAGVGIHIAKIGLDPFAVKLTDLGPSRIMGYFSCVSDAVHIMTDDIGITQFITLKIFLAITQVLLFIILAVMAYCTISIYCQMYFLLYAGFVLTGFAGSSWTANYWQRYVQAISYVAIKFFVISILMGFLMAAMSEWAAKFAGVVDNNFIGIAGVCLNVIGSAIILAMIVWNLPEWAANTLSGTVKINLADRLSAFSKS